MANHLSMNNQDDFELSSKFDESAQILEDWINLRTLEDHAQWNKLYDDIIKRSQKH